MRYITSIFLIAPLACSSGELLQDDHESTVWCRLDERVAAARGDLQYGANHEFAYMATRVPGGFAGLTGVNINLAGERSLSFKLSPGPEYVLGAASAPAPDRSKGERWALIWAKRPPGCVVEDRRQRADVLRRLSRQGGRSNPLWDGAPVDERPTKRSSARECSVRGCASAAAG